jgi:hypothetical protein
LYAITISDKSFGDYAVQSDELPKKTSCVLILDSVVQRAAEHKKQLEQQGISVLLFDDKSKVLECLLGQHSVDLVYIFGMGISPENAIRQLKTGLHIVARKLPAKASR